PAAVDARRAPPEEVDGAVLLDGRQVTRKRPAMPLDFHEGAGGLLGVVVVAEGDATRLGQTTDHARAGLHPPQLVVEDGAGVVDDEAPSLHRPPLVAGLR